MERQLGRSCFSSAATPSSLLYVYHTVQLQYELSDSQSFLTSRPYRLTLTIISRPRIDSAAAVYSPIIDRVSFFPTRGRSCTVYAYR